MTDDLTPRERHRRDVFARDPHRCALAQSERACGGFLQADHILKVTALERRQAELRLIPASRRLVRQHRFATAPLDELIADPRNGWILDERHHGLKDRRLIDVSRFLPAHFWAFVEEYGLHSVAEREGFVQLAA